MFVLPALLALALLQQKEPQKEQKEPSESATLPGAANAVQTALGRGFQIYQCTKGVWAFQSPEATLIDPHKGTELGTHGAGPTWTWKDGSSLTGEVAEKMNPPEPGSIPWLLLRAKRVATAPQGVLTNIIWIRRSDTHGGVAPATGCDAAHEGTVNRVPYSATYTFYSEP